MKKLLHNPKARVKIGFWLLVQKIEKLFFYLLILLLPLQLGLHFWPQFANVYGVRVDYLSPTLYITDVLILLLLVQFLIFPASPRGENFQFELKLKILDFKLVFLSAFLAIGIVLSKNPMAGVYGLLKLLEFIFIGIYIARKTRQLNFENVLLFLSIGVIFESLLSILQFVHRGSLNGIFYFFGERFFNSQTPGIANAFLNGELILRPYGTFPHPNVLAGYLLIAMSLIFLNFKLSVKLHEKIFFLTSVLLGQIALFLSMSRVALFLWLIIFCFGAVKYSRGLFNVNKLLKYVFLPLVLLMFIFLPFFIRARFINLRLSDESLTTRGVLIKNALLIIEKSPIMGLGINNYLQNFYNLQRPTNLFFYLQPVHNIYLLIMVQVGLVGFGFFLWFIYKTYKKMICSSLKIKESLLISLSCILFIGFFDHYFLTLQQGQLLFSFILGLCWLRKTTK